MTMNRSVFDQRMELPCSQVTDFKRWMKLQNDELCCRRCINGNFAVVEHSFTPFWVFICVTFLLFKITQGLL